ncbi:LysR family transcriptional regulator ArgP [Gordonia soli]|uniref:Putative LysR family transcriptional regulator n=1 Tax=Gordonia soli NBRC 108243 TaxID=1223545 RepID=M0QF32_9ACTN|nr:LysR family transcriptional regulator ArgP [Gordonia soli]GAC67064.1 putative LysR family transcriptional regulator [Gordonia soli NBRC 108243]
MDISHDGVVTLAVVLREGTFDAAAKALHITPSAVSQRIKALETAVGRIVVRRTKPATATPDGEVLVRLAEQWTLLVDEAQSQLVGLPDSSASDPRDRPRVHVPIAANADSLATWLLPVLAQAHRDHPMAVEVMRDDESQNSLLLRSGEVLGAITSDPIAIRGCTIVPLGAMRYLPVATPEFVETWLPDGPTDRDLARAPMVMFDRNDYLQRDTLRTVTAGTIDPPIVYIPASTEYHRAIAAGMGWGAVPIAQVPDALADGSLVPIVDSHVDVPLHWQFWTLSSPLLAALTTAVVDAARRELVQI